MSVLVNFAVHVSLDSLDLIQLILNSIRDVNDVGLELSDVLSLRNNENGVQFNISMMPFVEKTDFLIEVRLQSISDSLFFVECTTVRVSDN